MSEEQSKFLKDIRESLLLPKTDFPMKANLSKKEPDIIKYWDDIDLFGQLRANSATKEKFILHDGPPYANGNVHIGTALNKILKDMIVRSQQMMGRNSNYVPGWDCHGLPIEWKIEEQYRKKGKNKDDIPIAQFRSECRAFAEKWIKIQRDEFKRLGVVGNWDSPYTTMSFDAEAQIVRELVKFVKSGSVYKGYRPVMWSSVEKTALAEAEVEYHDYTSRAIHVRFPIINNETLALKDASIVIWTTTPWTIPGNRAIAFSNRVRYGLYEVEAVANSSLCNKGEKLVLADDLINNFCKESGIEKIKKILPLEDLDRIVCSHPFRGFDYEFDVGLFHADFVTTDQGTGFVHVAPGHGPDDFELGKKHNIAEIHTVSDEGKFYPEVPIFSGKYIINPDGSKGSANGCIIDKLRDTGKLIAEKDFLHSYPHSWRSKAPVIFRCTPQWFISMEKNNLRKLALDAINNVKWFPPQGRDRIYSMIENRPDWVISRQRAWGVPITIFVYKDTGEILVDDEVNKKIVTITEQEGAGAWFNHESSFFLCNKYNPEDFEKVEDILDVWFDSGSSHSFVLEKRQDLKWPASLYLEGTDQHRGWFHSSLLESCGTRGRAPYEAVLTHGFVMHEDGKKMSKSLGNTIAPQEIADKNGAEILRLWVASSDYTEDLKIGPEIIKSNVEYYRKIRNTIRFILANLNNWDEKLEKVDIGDLPELERLILHKIYILNQQVQTNYKNFDFLKSFNAAFNFCTNDLSSFYFDVRKDSLYCDARNSHTRKSTRTVLNYLFYFLVKILAPILCFSMEEAWLVRKNNNDSVHLHDFEDIPKNWLDEDLNKKWNNILSLRKVVNGAIEIERQSKKIRSSLEAIPAIYCQNKAVEESIKNLDLSEIFITSSVYFLTNEKPDQKSFSLDSCSNVHVIIEKATGEKCERCWKVNKDISEGGVKNNAFLCNRCSLIVKK